MVALVLGYLRPRAARCCRASRCMSPSTAPTSAAHLSGVASVTRPLVLPWPVLFGGWVVTALSCFWYSTWREGAPKPRPRGPRMPMSRKPKIALCLPGGGATGAMFQIGALAALEDGVDGLHAHEFDLYIGTSSGASVAAALAGGRPVRAHLPRVSRSGRHLFPARAQTHPAHRLRRVAAHDRVGGRRVSPRRGEPALARPGAEPGAALGRARSPVRFAAGRAVFARRLRAVSRGLLRATRRTEHFRDDAAPAPHHGPRPGHAANRSSSAPRASTTCRSPARASPRWRCRRSFRRCASGIGTTSTPERLRSRISTWRWPRERA